MPAEFTPGNICSRMQTQLCQVFLTRVLWNYDKVSLVLKSFSSECRKRRAIEVFFSVSGHWMLGPLKNVMAEEWL